ncbi:4910_t:CDS:1 [Diversispora eburnea]|uniref:4910_t:CDS:1 n=1 Tax=Diversispora eburnea TaxID=1213867 RepID=A0A9N9AMI5_9GLOM|nr:4910_t:CDS:1 [Diversispora eburnea]
MSGSNNRELRPPKDDYRHYSSKAYFTHLPNQTQFQQGYLGVQPSKVCGFFHLRYSDDYPLKVDLIELIFKGKVSVKWPQKTEAGTSVTLRGINKFVRLTKQLWSSPQGNFESITKLDLPFEFNIPEVSPTSIPFIEAELSTVGKINYSIKARIHRKSLIKKSANKIVEVWININRYILLPPIQNYEILPMIKKSKMIECQATLNHTIFDINSGIINVPIKFTLFDMRTIVKKVVIKLKQYSRLKVDNLAKINSNYVASHEVSGNQILVNPDSPNEFLIKMQIDLSKCDRYNGFGRVGYKTGTFGLLRCGCTTHYIDIYHKIKVVVNLGKASVSCVNFEKEIMIRNLVPLNDSNINLELERRIEGNIQYREQNRWDDEIDEISGDELPEYLS